MSKLVNLVFRKYLCIYITTRKFNDAGFARTEIRPRINQTLALRVAGRHNPEI
jgi:hypothetical protein